MLKPFDFSIIDFGVEIPKEPAWYQIKLVTWQSLKKKKQSS